MKRLEVRYRKSASNDLAEIRFYLRNVGASPRTARASIARLREACRRTGNAPEGGRARDDLASGLRMWSFERRAVITYVVNFEAVRIVNVFHRGRDIDSFYAARRGEDRS